MAAMRSVAASYLGHLRWTDSTGLVLSFFRGFPDLARNLKWEREAPSPLPLILARLRRLCKVSKHEHTQAR